MPSARSAESPTIHVALDLRLIHHSGIGSYLRGLLAGFADLLAPIDWTFIGSPVEVPPSLQVREWIEFDAPLYSLREFRSYPDVRGADVFHYPHYNLPMARAPHRLVTVYDLFHLRYGDWKRRAYQRFFLRRLASMHTPVTTISEKSREDLLAHSAIPSERITTIELGPGRPIPRGRPAAASAPYRLKSGATLNPPWFLAAGLDKPHKNFDFLLSAMSLWYRRRNDAPPLIWTGATPEQIVARTRDLPAHTRKRIFFEPYQSDDRIEQLYAGAMALIFPSIDEGFGFPPLEAMARDVPTVCAQHRPMTDLLESAPLWFDERDSSTLWRALDRLIDERGLRDQAIESGRRQVARFSWRKTAEETYRWYCEALKSSR